MKVSPRCLGLLGRTRKRSSSPGFPRWLMMQSPPSPSRPSACGTRYSQCPQALGLLAARSHLVASAAPTGFARAVVPRPLPSPLPLADAPGSGGAAARAASAPANANTATGRAFEARRLHVGWLRRRQREVRRGCARTARATTQRRPAARHARWHDEMHGSVQRIGGHHGRDSSQTGRATPITAAALTGRSSGCRTTPDW